MLSASDPADIWPDVATGEGLRARSVKGAAVTAAAQGVRLVLTLGSQIWLARLLSPVDFGLVAMVTPVIGFVAVVADLGSTQALVSRPTLRRSDINAFFWLNIAITTALAVVAAISAPLIGILYHEPRIVGVTLASASLIAIGGAGLVQAALLNRAMRFGVIAAIEVAALALSVTVGIISALSGCGYWSLVIAQAVASITATMGSWIASPWRPAKPALTRDASAMTRFGGQVTVANLASYLNATFDNALIGTVRGAVELGLYDRAWRFAVQPLTLLTAPFQRVALPALSRLASDQEKYRDAFGKMCQIMLIGIAPAMIVAAIDARALIGAIIGVKWVAATPVFAWLCVGAIVTPVNNAIFWAFVSQGQANLQMRVTLAAIGINLAAYAVGVSFGVVAVAKFSAISVYLLQTPILLWAVTRSGSITASFLRRLLAPNAAAAGVAAVIAFTLSPYAIGFWNLTLAGAASLAGYFLTLTLFSASRNLLRAIGNAGGSLLHRRSDQAHAHSKQAV